MKRSRTADQRKIGLQNAVDKVQKGLFRILVPGDVIVYGKSSTPGVYDGGHTLLYLDGGYIGTGGIIELYEGSENGRLLGSARLGGDPVDKPFGKNASIHLKEPLADISDICLVMKPDPGSKLYLDHFHFYAAAIPNP